MHQTKGNKKVVNAWAMYDWANSAYSLVITSALFPIYFHAITSGSGERTIRFLGMNFNSDSLQSYSISLAFLVIAFINPLLSSIADFSGRKKQFMYFFCTLGSLACSSLFFFSSAATLWIGVVGSMLAAIGFSGSIVFYNAFLPEIARPEERQPQERNRRRAGADDLPGRIEPRVARARVEPADAADTEIGRRAHRPSLTWTTSRSSTWVT